MELDLVAVVLTQTLKPDSFHPFGLAKGLP
jgi:hypothetical protein